RRAVTARVLGRRPRPLPGGGHPRYPDLPPQVADRLPAGAARPRPGHRPGLADLRRALRQQARLLARPGRAGGALRRRGAPVVLLLHVRTARGGVGAWALRLGAAGPGLSPPGLADVRVGPPDGGGAVLAGQERPDLGEVRRGGPGRATLADLGAERADGRGEVLHLWWGVGGVAGVAAAGRL